MKLMSVLEGTWTGVPWFWSLAICKNVFYLVNVQLIWLFFQFSALSTVSGCLPFTVNTCNLTSLTKGSSKQMRGFFGLICISETCPSHPCPSLLLFLYSFALYSPTFLSIIHLVILSLSLPLCPVWFPRTGDFFICYVA